MTKLLNTNLSDIHDGDILAVVEELEAVCPVGSRHFLNLPLRMFLTQCVYPGGTGTKRIPISTATVAISPLLESTIGKLPDGALFDLCREIATADGIAREFSHGQKLCVFLSRTIDKYTPSKAPTERQRRINNIVQRRRNNRR